jgi:hypothetical protein
LKRETVGTGRLPEMLFLSFFMMICSALAAADTVFSANAVKAAYLHRFASYVEWPSGTGAGASFVIAVAGDDEVAAQLEKLLPGLTVRGRPAVLRRVSRVQDLEGVRILYVGPKALRHTRALRVAASRKPILIVTDDERGMDAGGVINFVEVNRNVRFEISLNAADRSGLKIDSALLSVAARVERRPQTRNDCPEPRLLRNRHSTCAQRMAVNYSANYSIRSFR